MQQKDLIVCSTPPEPPCKSCSVSFCQNLALCTAALMYILSRDRLNMDLDRACLELMIKLLEFDQDHSAHQDQLTAKEVEKVKEKIRKLCETVHNKHLDLENITVGHTVMIKNRLLLEIFYSKKYGPIFYCNNFWQPFGWALLRLSLRPWLVPGLNFRPMLATTNQHDQKLQWSSFFLGINSRESTT